MVSPVHRDQSAIALGGDSQPLPLTQPPYLQRQLQAQVFCVVAEYSPGCTEEDVMYCSGLVLDIMLQIPGASVRA